MKTQALLRDLLLVSVIFFMVLGIFKGPNAYRKIGQALEEDVLTMARFLDTTLEEQQRLLQFLTQYPYGGSEGGQADILRRTETTLSNYQEASRQLSFMIFKWTTISIIILMALLCALVLLKVILLNPRTRF